MNDKHRMIHGVKWAAARAWGMRLSSLLVFMVLTRLLSPADIGAVAMVSAILAILLALSELGLADYLLYAEDSEKTRNQIFFFQLTVAAVLACVTFIAAPLMLDFLGRHDSANVIKVLCWSLPLATLTMVHDAVLRKTLDFKTIAVRSLISSVAGAMTGIAAAFAGAGLWSIVIKHLVELTLMAVLIWRASSWRPTWQIDFSGFKSIISYGGHIAGARMLDVLAANLDDLIVGGAMGQRELGIYSVGKRIYQICNDLIGAVTSQVAGPVFARAQGDIAQLRGMYLQAMRMSAWLVMPFYTTLLLFCPLIVPLIFGAQWQDSVWVLQLFCVVGFLSPLSQFNWAVFMAAAPSRISLFYSVLRNGFSMAALLVGGLFGMNGILFSQIGRSIILFLTGRGYLFRYVQIHLRSFPAALVPALMSTGLIALGVLLVRMMTTGLVPWLSWGLQMLLGGALLLASCALLYRSIRSQQISA
ncbi:lipopolysaccharide biosynthesis protein [Jeongeupia sp. HS-3]|uniref:lipopolysaccharide biosynthesis protein n=1 Tax=Jeongeupia sp. HS-3 TaxID=1009682 RepID=UPI0018A35D1E|nr:lipopolysaccharide biosynthesis protein [Jeongeupia sp. HS-3]BCL74674.1 lipopolysaccharide biosynthesis protein [Jeongeupia sp. HS-3]